MNRTWSTISNPGKFEGEHVSVPHLWGDCLSGCAYDDGETFSLQLDHTDWARWPELHGLRSARLWKDQFGFVYCRFSEEDL